MTERDGKPSLFFGEVYSPLTSIYNDLQFSKAVCRFMYNLCINRVSSSSRLIINLSYNFFK